MLRCAQHDNESWLQTTTEPTRKNRVWGTRKNKNPDAGLKPGATVKAPLAPPYEPLRGKPFETQGEPAPRDGVMLSTQDDN
jgi:hypothetical protein